MNEIARVFAIQALAFFGAACLETCEGYMKQTDKNIPAVKSYLRFSGITLAISIACSIISRFV